ncbi:hypothetical protein [Chryseobacterium oryzae]|uniref:Uncharacterized protein n=1 Tax=Chryseobacterium oryzae TaxID=2929799 RepID=A0ABY4BPG2_9FLAO|nr:hypothetical protein [Chryseobacterium oryzae]UOE39676.1 hypothetical protein MTP08_14610 [Chryseobacterium oryzae]
MTERFKDAVKKCVEDGILTSEEWELLRKVAKEENLNETDADVYITGELKKKKNFRDERDKKTNETKRNWGDNLVKTGEVIVAVGGFVLTVLTAMGKIGGKMKK